jgi:hypothetical protein
MLHFADGRLAMHIINTVIRGNESLIGEFMHQQIYRLKDSNPENT